MTFTYVMYNLDLGGKWRAGSKCSIYWVNITQTKLDTNKNSRNKMKNQIYGNKYLWLGQEQEHNTCKMKNIHSLTINTPQITEYAPEHTYDK